LKEILATEPSLTGAAWTLAQADEGAVQGIVEELGCSTELARCLAIRGRRTPLSPGLEALPDPGDLPALQDVAQRLRRITEDRAPLRLVAPTDAEGSAASLLVSAALRRVGSGPLILDLPGSWEEAERLRPAALERCATDGQRHLLSLAPSSPEARTRARTLGIDLLEGLGEGLDPGTAALLLARSLLEGHPSRDQLLRSLLKLASLSLLAGGHGTWTPRSRAILRLGLDELNRERHSPGLAALLQSAGTHPGALRSSLLARELVPRLDGLGRPDLAVMLRELMDSGEARQARARAEALDKLHTARVEVRRRMMERALEPLLEHPPPVLVVAIPEDGSWHRGSLPALAREACDRLGRPVAALALGQDRRSRGCLATPAGLHARAVLTDLADLLESLRGSADQATFRVHSERLDALRGRLCESAWQLARPLGVARRRAELRLPDQALTEALQLELSRLEPCGRGNPRPRIWLEPTRLQDPRLVKGRHLKARIEGGDFTVDAVWPDAAQHLEAARQRPLALLGTLGLSTWAGIERLQFRIEDAR
jgi:single-stranded-DNA-specific exonuclease